MNNTAINPYAGIQPYGGIDTYGGNAMTQGGVSAGCTDLAEIESIFGECADHINQLLNTLEDYGNNLENDLKDYLARAGSHPLFDKIMYKYLAPIKKVTGYSSDNGNILVNVCENWISGPFSISKMHMVTSHNFDEALITQAQSTERQIYNDICSLADETGPFNYNASNNLQQLAANDKNKLDEIWHHHTDTCIAQINKGYMKIAEKGMMQTCFISLGMLYSALSDNIVMIFQQYDPRK